jgi:YD repeat-containing protein
MKYLLNTNLVPIFSGTYDNFWEITDYNEDGDQELEVNYDKQDFLRGIASVYQDHSEWILKEFDITFIRGLKFTGDFTSPKEYNFSTDTLDFEVDINKASMLRTLEELKDNQNFIDFLRNHYTSRDGFWSWTPNNPTDLINEIKSNGSECDQSIGALIRFLSGIDEPKEFWDTIEGQVFLSWQGNGYGGTNYTSCNHEIKDWGCINKKCFNYQS